MATGIARLGFIGLVTLAVLFPAQNVSAVSRTGALPGIEALEAGNLKSIAAWLKASGRDGYLSADVADAAGIPRGEAEEVLEAKQRGFKTDNVLRIAQISTDEKRDFLLFMVQRPDGEVYFYLSSIKDGLRKAFVSIPGRNAVLPLDAEEAHRNFQSELLFWQARIGASG